MSKHQIFISHSGTDPAWVQKFAQSLQSRGATVWLDPWPIPSGGPTAKEMEQGLRGSDVIAFVLTPESFQLPNFFFELGAAIGGRKRMVPIVPKDLEISRLPYPLRVRKTLTKESPQATANKLLEETAA